MKTFKFFVRGSSLFRKVIVIYILLSVIPILLITFAANILYTNNFISISEKLVEENSQQHRIIIEERMEQYENLLYDLLTDRDYLQLALKVDSGDEVDWLMLEEQMENKLRSLVYTYDGIRGIAFLADNDRYVSYSRWYLSNQEIMWSNLEDRKAIHDEVEAQEGLTFIGMVNLSSRNSEDYVMLMGFPVRDLRSKEQSGVIVMALKADILLFDTSTQDNGVTTLIADDSGRILTGVDASYTNQSLDTYLEDHFTGLEYSVSSNSIKGTKWSVVNIIDLALQRQEIRRFTLIVFGIMVGITVLFFTFVLHISRKYVEEIQKIVRGLEGFDGSDPDSLEIELGDKDELYVIALQFNQMTRRVKRLVEALEQRTEEVRVAAINQKHAEIKALEAQINPHFLFNTLDSINWRAIEHDEEEISDMLGALGSLLRYSVSNIDMVVVLEAEISWLRKYVFLQRDRFNNSFDCIYDVTEEAMAFPIYKMLLQPIIENTILHAFEDVKEGGLIRVHAFVREDGRLQIHIRDNGCGMEEERLREIRKEIHGNGALNSRSIGISNVIHRLHIYYQEEAEIKVESTLGEGTEFVLVIPDHSEKQEDV